MARSHLSPAPLDRSGGIDDHLDTEAEPADVLAGLRPLPLGSPWERLTDRWAGAPRSPGQVLAVLGAVLGAGWLALVGESRESYLQLFGLSSAARLLALAFLLRVPQMEIRAIAMSLRTLALRPSDGGSLDRPILSTLEDEPREEVPQ